MMHSALLRVGFRLKKTGQGRDAKPAPNFPTKPGPANARNGKPVPLAQSEPDALFFPKKEARTPM
ncbi:MAG: hypothetical protein D6714_10145 [Bacteroidetes bacterium]|nr:MAG: hypothetical protein D6714_10145 [Bacteroidota bacterium]